METIRDSTFGKLVRVFTRNRLLRYPEEVNPALWTECLKPEPSVKDEEAATLADTEEDTFGLYAVMSQASRASRRLNSIASTAGVDRGTPLLVDWRGPDDPEVRIQTCFPEHGLHHQVLTCMQNPQNWSTTKKLLVSSQIWMLTFAIYIGSAIYTPGIEGVSEQFGVSRVAATLGLTLFVLGYGLGTSHSWIVTKRTPINQHTNHTPRSNGLVPSLRATNRRPKPYIHPHPRRLCLLPIRRHLRKELRHATRIPVLDRLSRLPSPCNRRSIHGRHVEPESARLHDRYLGLFRHLRTRPGPSRRRLRSLRKRMDMDHLAAALGQRVHTGPTILLPPGNLHAQYSLATSTSRTEDHGELELQMRSGDRAQPCQT